MRKQEAVHLHALLVEAARDADRRGHLAAGALEDYQDMDVTPTAVHRSKDAHEDAVLVLARGIREGMERSADAERETRVQ